MSSQTILVLGIIVATFLVIGIAVLFFIPRGKVAEILAQPSVPFELRCAPANDKPYRLCTRYSLTWTEGRKTSYGLACEISAEVDGNHVLTEVVGVGPRQVKPTTAQAGTEYLTSSRRSPTGHARSSTVVLAALGERPLNSEIAVRGTITASDNLMVRSLKVYIAR